MNTTSSIIKNIEYNPLLIAEIGDCPNIEMHTRGGEVFWRDLSYKKGWKLQKNIFTGHARILDEKNIRKAWGSRPIMEEKFKRLLRDEFLEPGDIIGIARKKALNAYEHYGIYIGNNRVVHYSGRTGDFKSSVAVRIVTLNEFLQDDRNYFVLFFGENNRIPHKLQNRTSFNLSDFENGCTIDLTKAKDFKLYSAEDTVKRALSRVGEEKYNLIVNNCEHFAVWCKTGVSKSYQVSKVARVLADGISKNYGVNV